MFRSIVNNQTKSMHTKNYELLMVQDVQFPLKLSYYAVLLLHQYCTCINKADRYTITKLHIILITTIMFNVQQLLHMMHNDCKTNKT